MTKGEGLIDQKEKSAAHRRQASADLSQQKLNGSCQGTTQVVLIPTLVTEKLIRGQKHFKGPAAFALLAQLFAFSHFSELISQKLPTYRQLALLNVVVLLVG